VRRTRLPPTHTAASRSKTSSLRSALNGSKRFSSTSTERAARGTSTRTLRSPRNFFKFQILRGKPHGDPTLAIERATPRQVYRTTFSDDQRRAIIAEAEDLRDRIALACCSSADCARARSRPAFAGLFSIRWTRTQRIRTAAAVPLQAMMVHWSAEPVYVSLAEKAKHLHTLGMRHKAIAGALGVSDKTVAKAIAAEQSGRPEQWLLRFAHCDSVPPPYRHSSRLRAEARAPAAARRCPGGATGPRPGRSACLDPMAVAGRDPDPHGGAKQRPSSGCNRIGTSGFESPLRVSVHRWPPAGPVLEHVWRVDDVDYVRAVRVHDADVLIEVRRRIGQRPLVLAHEEDLRAVR
jgi:hypothetical protein